ncbi:Ig-like domain-containing protein, partial [Colwellia sp. Bg11-28]|uniref:Ig-like domain-containing protein n=1 Tax=Colwellia sp. Bg11-28 TaxID=2058305 RepID=UPI000CC747F6
GNNAVITLTEGGLNSAQTLITASPTSLEANGISTSIITVQVKDSNGNNVNNGGDVVSLTADLGTIGAVTDNSDGTYTGIYTSATTVGTATITGTLNSIVITDNASISLKNG